MQLQTISLAQMRPPQPASLTLWRFGPGEGAAAITILAGLRPGAVPGMLVAQVMADWLANLDAEGLVKGPVLLIPVAHPQALQARLGPDAGDGPATALPSATEPDPPWEALSQALQGCARILWLDSGEEAALHCQAEAAEVARIAPLARRLNAPVVVTEPAPADGLYAGWVRIMLRGDGDVSPTLAQADAEALVAHLADLGLLAEAEGDHAEALGPAVQILERLDRLRAPVPGLVAWRVSVGAEIEAGQTLAEIIDPVTGAITPLQARTHGVLLDRIRLRTVPQGRVIGHLAR